MPKNICLPDKSDRRTRGHQQKRLDSSSFRSRKKSLAPKRFKPAAYPSEDFGSKNQKGISGITNKLEAFAFSPSSAKTRVWPGGAQRRRRTLYFSNCQSNQNEQALVRFVSLGWCLTIRCRPILNRSGHLNDSQSRERKRYRGTWVQRTLSILVTPHRGKSGQRPVAEAVSHTSTESSRPVPCEEGSSNDNAESRSRHLKYPLAQRWE